MPVKDRDRIATVLFEDEKAVEIHISDPSEKTIAGNIYVGHVINIVPESGGAFVRLDKDHDGFLPLGKIKRPIYKNVKKNQELKAEDEILIFVEADALKTKHPTLSTEIKLTGKYLVISNELQGFSFSKKLSKEKKEELRSGLAEIEGNYGFIVRTKAAAADISKVCEEAESLSKRMDEITKFGVMRPAGTCLYKSDSIWMEKIRQLEAEETESVVTDDPEIFEEIMNSDAADADIKSRVRLYEDKMLNLFRLYSLGAVIDNAFEKKVWLKSGASIIIEQTEAFVSIDVNSSKSVKNKRNDERLLEINIEAAREAARQMRLRQLSGVILIDFINMKSKDAQETLLLEMKKLVKNDSSAVNVIDMTPLGIMEITRKKKGRSLKEQLI